MRDSVIMATNSNSGKKNDDFLTILLFFKIRYPLGILRIKNIGN